MVFTLTQKLFKDLLTSVPMGDEPISRLRLRNDIVKLDHAFTANLEKFVV